MSKSAPKGTAIPTKLDLADERDLDDLCSHTGLSRSEIIRRAVQLLLAEVRKRGHAAWIITELGPPLAMLDPVGYQAWEESEVERSTAQSAPSTPPSESKFGRKKSIPKQLRARLRDKSEVAIFILNMIPAGWPDNRVSIKPKRKVMVAKGLFPEGAFGLDVSGDSMNRARGKFGPILDGQTVVLLPPDKRESKHGDIVAALCDGQTTLKRLDCKLGPKCVLRAESDSSVWKDSIKPAHDLVIQGVVIGKL